MELRTIVQPNKRDNNIDKKKRDRQREREKERERERERERDCMLKSINR